MADNNDMVEDDEEEIDDEQVEDYCEMLDRLGNFPEKVAINSLSMAAEDFDSSPKSAAVIFHCIRSRLVDCTTPGISSPDRKLPLVYVLDSLLKNVKGVYTDIILGDAVDWLTEVYNIFDKAHKEDEKARLKKVWSSWKQFGVIKDDERWRQIGQCFFATGTSGGDAASPNSSAIARNADGSLQLPSKLRAQMQILLDEVQADGVDELEKVSLERLADINPSLLLQIKEAAEIELQDSNQTHSSVQSSSIGTMSNNITSIPPPPISEWSKLKLNHLEKSHDIVASLQRHVRSASQQTTVLQSQKDNTVHLYASLSASAQILTDMLHQWKVQQENGTWFGIGEDSSSSSRRKRRYSLVRKEQFTTEGIKEHNDAVIARLYEVGLPFLCSADGRRFATQLELSNHLDAMFRKSQLDKTMEKMEERGWYLEEKAWERGGSIVNVAVSEADETMEAETLFTSMGDAEDDVATSANTVVADESRDRCILCGINFAMFFDQEDGEWKYRNCVEKDVEVNDGPTMDEDEAEAKLVHYSCWKGLGSPAFLTADQVLHAN